MKNRTLRNCILAGSACTLILAAAGWYFFGTAAGILFLLLGAALTGGFALYSRRRYAEIRDLNDYLVRVLAGEDVPDILDQQEGELSILKSNIYKTTTMLKSQKELLAEDKADLAKAIADISHQLKTPLTSMMVMNDLLKSEENPEKRQEFLDVQQTQLVRMNWLIQTLLKLSKLDAGTVELKRGDVSVRSLVDEALKPFAIMMEMKGIGLAVSCDDIRVKCDENWTVEAIQNIIKNCCEHMDRGDTLSIETGDTNLFTRIVIADTGCGIAAEDLPHIFERFYKGKNAGKDSVGIGLSLSKTILENQSGDILVQSTEGSGTRFEMRFYKTII